MIFFLMHKNDPVILLDFNESGDLIDYSRKYNQVLLPLLARKDITFLKDWIIDRAISRTRHDLKGLLKNLQVSSTHKLLLENRGLSLTDCYWLKSEYDTYTWEDINLFKNDFSDMMYGSYTQKSFIQKNNTNFSPNSSLQGELKKKWVIDENGKRLLIKGNYGSSWQQSLNEEFATLINKKQGIDFYVPYYTQKTNLDGDISLCCFSENFIKDDSTEFISAWDVTQSQKIKGCRSIFYQFIDGCVENGLKREDVLNQLEYQIILDYLLTNTDRHFNNFGVIRDTSTLQFISMAPIYDCGNSMFWSNKNFKCNPQFMDKIETHSFKKKERALLDYVHDFSKIDYDLLPTDDEIYAIYCKDPTLDNECIEHLIQAFHYKKNQIQNHYFKSKITKLNLF